MPRKIQGSWVQAFHDATAKERSPSIFRLWAGIAAVSGVLERKNYTITSGPLYPNIYVVLTAPAAIGKGITELIRDMWYGIAKETPGEIKLHIAPTSITAASLRDVMSRANRSALINGVTGSHFNSLLIGTNELQNFFPDFNPEFAGMMQDLWDCTSHMTEEKRTKETKIDVEKPSLMMLSGTTPTFLSKLLSSEVWDMGFASRVIFVYHSKPVKGLGVFTGWTERKYDDLRYDLRQIYNLAGYYDWSPEATQAIEEWEENDRQPAPDHPKFQNYKYRRLAHLSKLCMIACASSSDKHWIELPHFLEAKAWLEEADKRLGSIFESVVSPDMEKIESIYQQARAYVLTHETLVPKRMMMEFATMAVGSMQCNSIIKWLCDAEWIKSHNLGEEYAVLKKKEIK